MNESERASWKKELFQLREENERITKTNDLFRTKLETLLEEIEELEDEIRALEQQEKKPTDDEGEHV